MPDSEEREISGHNEIEQYLHCGKCFEEWKHTTGISPQEYQDMSVGWTVLGIQVWCNRHECNVMHVDFERHKHPANVYANPTTQ